MSLRLVGADEFEWTSPSGPLSDSPAGVVRHVTSAADAHDGVANLNEAALLALAHQGVAGATLLLSDEVGFALLRGDQLDVLVAPQARGLGHGTALLGEIIKHTRGSIEAWSHADHPAAGALSRTFGFDRVRDLWVMQRELRDTPGVVADPGLRAFREEDLPSVIDLNARAFAHHPEQGGLTAEDFEQRMAEEWFDPDGLIIGEVDGVARGFHWTKIHPDGTGEVYVVAVAPDATGHGLGKRLTLAGLAHLRERGCSEVLLYVDADNSPAVGLYQRLGFQRARGEAQYSRPAPT